MDIVSNFIEHDGKATVERISAELGLEIDNITSIIHGLIPELNKGVQTKIASGPSGFSALLQGIDMSSLSKLILDDSSLAEHEANSLGSLLLSNIFGGESGTRIVIDKISKSSGVAVETIQSAIPQITTSFISYFSKSTGGVSDLIGGLSTSFSMFDSDGDAEGEVSEDLLEAAKKIF